MFISKKIKKEAENHIPNLNASRDGSVEFFVESAKLVLLVENGVKFNLLKQEEKSILCPFVIGGKTYYVAFL